MSGAATSSAATALAKGHIASASERLDGARGGDQYRDLGNGERVHVHQHVVDRCPFGGRLVPDTGPTTTTASTCAANPVATAVNNILDPPGGHTVGARRRPAATAVQRTELQF